MSLYDDVMRDPGTARYVEARQGFQKHVEHTRADETSTIRKSRIVQEHVEHTDADRAKWREAARRRRTRETPEQAERRKAKARARYKRKYWDDPEFRSKEIRRVDKRRAERNAREKQQ